MALQAVRPQSSLFVTPKRAGHSAINGLNGNGNTKRKKNSFICPTCRSTEYTKEGGILICSLCGSGTTFVEEDDEGNEITYTKGKSIKSCTDTAVRPRDIVTTVQVILQLEVLITDFHCPKSLYNCTFQIWKAYLEAETSATTKKDKDGEGKRTGEIGPYIRDMDKDIDTKQAISLNLDITLCVLFLACLMLRLPFLSSDFVSWAKNGALPYKSATGKLRIENPSIYRLFFRKSQYVPNQSVLTRKTVNLAKFLNMIIPPINAPLVCYRVLCQLSLTILVPHLKQLCKYLPLSLFAYTSAAYGRAESRVISLIPLAFRRHFSSSSISSISSSSISPSSPSSSSFDNSSNKLDVGGWMRKYKRAQVKASLFSDTPFKGIDAVCSDSYEAFAGVSAKELNRLFEDAPQENTTPKITSQVPVLHPVTAPLSSFSSYSSSSTSSSSTSTTPIKYTIDGMYKVLLHVCANYTNDTSYDLVSQHMKDIETAIMRGKKISNKSPKRTRSSVGDDDTEKSGKARRIEDENNNNNNNNNNNDNDADNENDNETSETNNDYTNDIYLNESLFSDDENEIEFTNSHFFSNLGMVEVNNNNVIVPK